MSQFPHERSEQEVPGGWPSSSMNSNELPETVAMRNLELSNDPNIDQYPNDPWGLPPLPHSEFDCMEPNVGDGLGPNASRLGHLDALIDDALKKHKDSQKDFHPFAPVDPVPSYADYFSKSPEKFPKGFPTNSDPVEDEQIEYLSELSEEEKAAINDLFEMPDLYALSMSTTIAPTSPAQTVFRSIQPAPAPARVSPRKDSMPMPLFNQPSQAPAPLFSNQARARNSYHGDAGQPLDRHDDRGGRMPARLYPTPIQSRPFGGQAVAPQPQVISAEQGRHRPSPLQNTWQGMQRYEGLPVLQRGNQIHTQTRTQFQPHRAPPPPPEHHRNFRGSSAYWQAKADAQAARRSEQERRGPNPSGWVSQMSDAALQARADAQRERMERSRLRALGHRDHDHDRGRDRGRDRDRDRGDVGGARVYHYRNHSPHHRDAYRTASPNTFAHPDYRTRSPRLPHGQ